MTVQLYTDAPTDYDGFGTKTIAAEGFGQTQRGVVRLVEIHDRHLKWQRLRYQSGRLFVGTAEELALLRRAGCVS